MLGLTGLYSSHFTDEEGKSWAQRLCHSLHRAAHKIEAISRLYLLIELPGALNIAQFPTKSMYIILPITCRLPGFPFLF